ncbi:uncharacterized protein TRUGW13939_08838 [Talaromyces rugulosus]|uniref:Uncharacterized protein n=1 Tax=Talaromyces rugulosus TaxID=121627 RepID=A0A7H8RAQ9_TALRU|nr:uncharacterized protein TRUGW13939_08838 [Talaromyces rugulosus]QKX61683.1 hypothetical protein TRUGW13939_08838 [Talaromyces rugulosus]
MDGVWRNFDGAKNVVSYQALSREEITEVLNVFPKSMRQNLAKKLEGVDGRDVMDIEQLLHPGKDLMPKFDEENGGQIKQ